MTDRKKVPILLASNSLGLRFCNPSFKSTREIEANVCSVVKSPKAKNLVKLAINQIPHIFNGYYPPIQQTKVKKTQPS